MDRTWEGLDIDLAVIIPPSRRKRVCPLPPATAHELDRTREQAERRLAPYACLARELYRGRQHRAMVDTIDHLRSSRPDLSIALFIVSAGYGLLPESAVVVPYEAALGSTADICRRRAAELGLHGAISAVLQSATFTLICLSAIYLDAIDAPSLSVGQPLYLAAPTATLGPNATRLPAGAVEARWHGRSPRDARAAVLAAVCLRVERDGLAVLAEAVRRCSKPPSYGTVADERSTCASIADILL